MPERGAARGWRRSARPVAVVAAAAIGLGVLAGAAGAGLGALASSSDRPSVHHGHGDDLGDADSPGRFEVNSR